MAPRGVKTLLRTTAPAKLVGEGKFKGYQSKETNRKCRGLTKQLQSRLWSEGILPTIARMGDTSIRPKKAWKGKKGGQTRGKLVDQQLTKLVNGGKAMIMRQKKMYALTRLALRGLAKRGLDPVIAQRSVLCEDRRLATAADVIAYERKTNRLVVVELKCGYDHGRKAAAERAGRPCKMKAPCSRVLDCNVNRHLAQLAVTRDLLSRERQTLRSLNDLGVESTIGGMLMYVNDEGVEYFKLDEWWVKKAPALVRML